MKEEQISQEKMKAMQVLAETNVKIGEARGILTNLKAEEALFLDEREQKALARVQTILDESEETLKKAFSNYEEIKKFASTASDFANFLLEAYNDFQELKKTHDEYTQEWEKKVESTETHLSEIKEQIKVDQEQIASDKESINKAWKAIGEEKRKIRSDRATLETAINRLKKGRI